MKVGLTIFILALAVRVVNLLFIDLTFESFLYEDQKMYWDGSYTYPMNFWSTSDGLVAERMPGAFWYYKLLIFMFKENLFLILFFQSILDSLTCLVISKSAKLVEEDLEKIVGFLAAISPTMVISSSQILSDTLFLLFFSISIYYFLVTISKKSIVSPMISGFMLGLSTLVRAVSYPLIFLSLPVLYIFNFKWMKKTNIFICLTGFLILSLSPLSPRLVNNIIHNKTFSLTSQTGTHLSYWFVPNVLAVSKGYDREKSIGIINDKIDSLGGLTDDPYKNSKIKTSVAIKILSEESIIPILYVWGKAATINIFSPAFLVDQRIRSLPHPSYIKSKSFKDWINLILENNVYYKYFITVLLSLAISIICFFLTIFGFGIFLYKKFYFTFFSSMLIFYFILITGPNVSPKYILPFISLIFLWQAVALKYVVYLINQMFKKKKYINKF